MRPSDKNQNRSVKMSGVAILQLSGASLFPRGEIHFPPKHPGDGDILSLCCCCPSRLGAGCREPRAGRRGGRLASVPGAEAFAALSPAAAAAARCIFKAMEPLCP